MLYCYDGEVARFWPLHDAENVLAQGQEAAVRNKGPNPFGLEVRPDQTASLYTFKLFASDEAHRFSTQGLLLPGTIQEDVDANPKGIVTQMPEVAWTTVEVPILVTK